MNNRCHITQEVTGSSPVPPTIASVLSEELGLRELLEALLGSEGRRRLALKHKTNDKLFTFYDAELILKVHNTRNLEMERRLLAKFHSYLNNYPPSPELAKGFLAQYSDRKPRTLARYSATIKSFMRWYGMPIEDFRVKIPKTLPSYTEDDEYVMVYGRAKAKRGEKTLDIDHAYLYRFDDDGKFVEGRTIPVDLYAFDEFWS